MARKETATSLKGAKSTTSSKKATNTNKRKTSKAKKKAAIKGDIYLLMGLCFIVLLILSNFGLIGLVGRGIKWFTFGLIGITEYIFPFLLAFHLLFRATRKKKTGSSKIKFAAAYGLMIVISAFAQRVINNPEIRTASIGDFFMTSAINKTGGGFFGGVLVKLLSITGLVGSIIIIVAMAFVCIVIITEWSVSSSINTAAKKTKEAADDYYQHADETLLKRQEARENKRQQRQELAQEKELRRQERLKERQRVLEEKERLIEEEIAKSASKQTDDKASENSSEIDPFFNYANEQLAGTSFVDDTRVNTGVSTFEEADNFVEGNQATAKQDDPFKSPFEADLTLGDGPRLTGPDAPSFLDSISSESDENSSLSGNFTKETDVESSYNSFQENSSDEDYLAAYEEDINGQGPADIARLSNAQGVSTNDSLEKTQGRAADVDTASKMTDSVGAGLVAGVAAKGGISELSKGKETGSTEDIKPTKEVVKEYHLPPINLLTTFKSTMRNPHSPENRNMATLLQQTLKTFGVNVKITNISCGPAVTRFELQPEMGVKVSKIVALADDIKLNLAAEDIRIEAPIPGKAAVGIEVPNKTPSSVSLRQLIESKEFKEDKSLISFGVGEDIAGKPIMADIAKMPHMLIAGATGSGKSVCINALIMSILYRAKPDQVKMIMVDPKVVELSAYNGIPHLLIPVVTDPKKASGALNWAAAEMDVRYKKFAEVGAKNLRDYNARAKTLKDDEHKPLPQLVVIVDELADLMMVAPGEVETAICRIAQLGRASGIHLVIATQRPSVNVITGLIKANVPSRIAFAVSSGVDSRTIIDMNGAEKLLGKGDMLYFPQGFPKPQRVQGAFVSDEEVAKVVSFWKEQNESSEDEELKVAEQITQTSQSFPGAVTSSYEDEKDAYFAEAGRLVISMERGSIGMLQRRLKIGFNRAARIMDQLTTAGVVGPEVGTKPREILMTEEQFEEFLKNL